MQRAGFSQTSSVASGFSRTSSVASGFSRTGAHMRTPLTALGVILLAACSTSAQPAKPQPAPSDIVATVGTRSFTLAEVDERALREAAGSFGNARLGQALYLARRAAIEQMVGNE